MKSIVIISEDTVKNIPSALMLQAAEVSKNCDLKRSQLWEALVQGVALPIPAPWKFTTSTAMERSTDAVRDGMSGFAKSDAAKQKDLNYFAQTAIQSKHTKMFGLCSRSGCND